MSGDVVGRRGRVPTHEQSAGNIDEAEGGEDDEEQVKESGDSPWVVGRAHVPSLIRVIREPEHERCAFLSGSRKEAIGETDTSDRSDRNGGTVPRPLIIVDNWPLHELPLTAIYEMSTLLARNSRGGRAHAGVYGFAP